MPEENSTRVREGHQPTFVPDTNIERKGHQPTGETPSNPQPPNVGPAAVEPTPSEPQSGNTDQSSGQGE